VPVVVELPARTLPPGLTTCQINVIDDRAKRFVFPRVTFAVR
jgi:hypothetical protein